MSPELLQNSFPFLCALTLIVLIGLLELLALIIGTGLFSHLDASFHLHADVPAPENLLSQGLDWLHLGKIPAMIVLVIWLGGFSLLGLGGQSLSLWWLGHPLPVMPTAIAAALLACPLLHYIGKWLSPYLPQDETSALSEDTFIGCIAEITGAEGLPGRPTECKLTDRYGQLHYIRVEPEAGERLQRGDSVLIIERLSSSHFLAEKNPWPEYL